MKRYRLVKTVYGNGKVNYELETMIESRWFSICSDQSEGGITWFTYINNITITDPENVRDYTGI